MLKWKPSKYEPAPSSVSSRSSFVLRAACLVSAVGRSVACRNCHASDNVEPANSIQLRWRARAIGSDAYNGVPLWVSSRYSQITMLSKMATSLPSGLPTSSSGTLPVGESARNQSGLVARSTSIRSNATPFSSRTMAARCTKGQRGWLMSFNMGSDMAICTRRRGLGWIGYGQRPRRTPGLGPPRQARVETRARHSCCLDVRPRGNPARPPALGD